MSFRPGGASEDCLQVRSVLGCGRRASCSIAKQPAQKGVAWAGGSIGRRRSLLRARSGRFKRCWKMGRAGRRRRERRWTGGARSVESVESVENVRHGLRGRATRHSTPPEGLARFQPTRSRRVLGATQGPNDGPAWRRKGWRWCESQVSQRRSRGEVGMEAGTSWRKLGDFSCRMTKCAASGTRAQDHCCASTSTATRALERGQGNASAWERANRRERLRRIANHNRTRTIARKAQGGKGRNAKASA